MVLGQRLLVGECDQLGLIVDMGLGGAWRPIQGAHLRRETISGDTLAPCRGPGRALEELWASLFSKFRSFGSTKRQHQSLWGPTVALTFNLFVSVGIILMNKLVLVEVGFNYPIFLTFIHYTFSWCLMALLKAFSMLPASPPSNSTRRFSLMFLGFVMCLSTGLANFSLNFNSVGFYQMAKIAVTPAIVLAEFMVFQRRISYQKEPCRHVQLEVVVEGVRGNIPTGSATFVQDELKATFRGAIAGSTSNKFRPLKIDMDGLRFDALSLRAEVLALAVASIGVAVATVTDLQFHFYGACIAVAWIMPSAANKILWSNLQQQQNWSALALMWKTTPITLVFLVVLMPFDPRGVISFNWNFYNSAMIGVSAVLGFLLQWSGALALGETSATTHVILGQFKTCVILLGGFFLFGSNPGKTSICGAIVAIVGMSFYTHLNLHRQQDSAKASPRQSSFSLPKSKLSKENGESDNGHRDELV
ncbi:hypothetical protein RJ639_029864 [Escallonia herrerae]|uniref:Sugar phosphate transporter domain-containing protein n=1 Tax=Escallonia herrerae TaxID=1293975 RepID=A0AA88X2A5_9ASTE|nr:hypothetical protein RJ639_029864 [Escallonia herrerae]